MSVSKVLQSSDILMGLAALRDDDILCDIILKAEGKTLSAHRAVLAAASPYFKALFTGGFRENDEGLIELKEMSFCGLSKVVDCFYTTNLELDGQGISSILATAHMLQITKIVDHCITFMRNNMSGETCFTFLKLAEKFDISEIRQDANEYILGNFVTIRQSNDFKQLSKDALIQYLGHDELKTDGDESEVFYAAKDWLEKDTTRMQYAEEIMNVIRFNSIKPGILSEIGETDLIDDRKHCRGLVRNALTYHAQQYNKPLNALRQIPRGKEGIFIIDKAEESAGWKNDKENKAYLVSISDGKSCDSKNIGKFLIESISIVEVNNFLFLSGVDSDTFLPVMMRYDPSCDEWLTLAPGPTGRKGLVGSSMARLGDNLFVVSGMRVTETSKLEILSTNFSNKVFMYNIATNEWKMVADIPTALCMAAASGCAINGCVYVTGGHSGTATLKDTFAYDTKADLWLTKPSMNHGRVRHCLELVQNKLYAIGGQNAGALVETCDILSEQWTNIKGMELVGTAACSVVKDDKIFILGGSWKVDDKYPETSAITIFDTTSETFKVPEITLPKPMSYHVCGLVTHPKLL